MVYLLILPLLFWQTDAASWTQQFVDAASSSYIPYTGSITIGWRYISQRGSSPYYKPLNPCVTEEGNVFYPLQSRVLAISPQGMVYREYDVQHINAEYYLELSNTIYSEKHKIVLVAASGTTQQQDGETLVRLSTLDVKSDSIKWHVDNIEPLSRPILLSETHNSVYVMAGRTLIAFSLTDGKSLWSNVLGSLIDSPIPLKIGTLPDNGRGIIIIPTVPGVNNGVLIALDASTGNTIWTKSLGFNYDGGFTLSPTGVVYGCTGLFPDVAHGKQINILDASSGKILYNGEGYCTDSERPMTPSADQDGNGYYNCGNQIFSVYSNGSLRWKSKVFGKQELPPHINPAIHPDGTIFYVTINGTTIVTFSAVDGTIIKTYSGREDVEMVQPPILVGDKYMYIAGRNVDSSAVLYPIAR